MNIELTAQKENLTQLLNSCEKYLLDNGIKKESTVSVLVAVEEIFINIASYAYTQKTGNVFININLNNDGNMKTVRILFEDSGIPFNPLEFGDKFTVYDKLNKLIPGGMGIFLVKSTMENLNYEYKNGKNIFSFEKTFGVENNVD